MPVTVEGVVLTDEELTIIACIQEVLDLFEAGEEEIQSDPSFVWPGEPPSDERVEEIIAALDEKFAHEIQTYPGYHRNRSGATTTPDFHRMPIFVKRILVERVKAIFMAYEGGGEQSRELATVVGPSPSG